MKQNNQQNNHQHNKLIFNRRTTRMAVNIKEIFSPKIKIYGIQLFLPCTKIKKTARNCHPYRQQAVYACTCAVTSSFFSSHLPGLICIGELSVVLNFQLNNQQNYHQHGYKLITNTTTNKFIICTATTSNQPPAEHPAHDL